MYIVTDGDYKIRTIFSKNIPVTCSKTQINEWIQIAVMLLLLNMI